MSYREALGPLKAVAGKTGDGSVQKHKQTQKATRNAKHDRDTPRQIAQTNGGDNVFLAQKYLGEKKDRLKGSKKEMPNKKGVSRRQLTYTRLQYSCRRSCVSPYVSLP